MHKPKIAPTLKESLDLISNNIESMGEIVGSGPCDDKGRYIHWDKLRFKKHPRGIDPIQWWAGMKFARSGISATLQPIGKLGESFHWCEPPHVREALHWLDIHAAGNLGASELISNTSTRNSYLFKSLVEEAISSSQLEGAATTIGEAKALIRENRKPADKDEQMILNNYQAMTFIREMKGEELSIELILELHKIVTKHTLDNSEKAGHFRTNNDNVRIVDENSEELYIPPKTELIEPYLKYVCDYANSKVPEQFVHPAIRAIITHFFLSWVHPFVDGNGRTARALFYWVMQRNGYWLMEYITISSIIKRAARQYGMAFLHCETDDNDLTYFIIHQLDVLTKAVEALQVYLENKQREIQESRNLIANNYRLNKDLNFRQLALLRHAIKHPRHAYRIQDHQRSHGITYETARKDLINLSKLGLLQIVEHGKANLFIVPDDLQAKLKN